MSPLEQAKAKIAHARQAVRECRWPGCKAPILPIHYCCNAHWFSLPHEIRGDIRHAKDVAQYRAAHERAQDWIRKAHPGLGDL